MITYEPPEQQEVNVGDQIEGIGTVADPDDLKVTELPQRPAVEGNRGGRPMTATETLRAMLDERGVEYRIERKQTRATFEPFDRFIVLDEHGGLRGTIDVYPDGACNCTWQFNDLTPEQTIAATLGRGKLNASQVSNAVYAHSIHADCADADWQAIADELNNMLDSSNCTNSERTDAACKPTAYDDGYSADRVDPGDYYEFWEPACACGNCGELIPMREFCPNCGARIEVDE